MDLTAGVRFPVRAGYFSLRHRVQSVCGAHPASYPFDVRFSLLGGKMTVA